MVSTTPQNYLRISDETDDYVGYLDDSTLVQHHTEIPESQLKQIIEQAIIIANRKSGREILSIP